MHDYQIILILGNKLNFNYDEKYHVFGDSVDIIF